MNRKEIVTQLDAIYVALSGTRNVVAALTTIANLRKLIEEDKLGIKTLFQMWDHREQIDFEELNDNLRAVFDGTHCPCVFAEIDTGGDYCAAVITSQEITDEEAQKAWDDYMAEMNEEPKA